MKCNASSKLAYKTRSLSRAMKLLKFLVLACLRYIHLEYCVYNSAVRSLIIRHGTPL